MQKTWIKSALLAGMVALAVSPAVLAETSSPQTNVQQPPHHRHHHDKAQWENFMARRQQELHEKLKLRPEQEAAWKTFVASMKHQPHQPGAMKDEPAPDRMQHMIDHMQKHLDELKTFYNQLSAEQKTTFDHWHMFPHGPMMHHHPMQKKQASQ